MVVYSHTLASAAIRGQQQRLSLAQTALDKLAEKPGDDLERLNQQVAAILKRHRVSEFFSVTTKEEILTSTHHVRRGRPTAKSPTQQVTRVRLQLQIQLQSTAIEQAEQLAGWRLYVTNAPCTQLTLPQAVIYYRDEWLLERGFHRFKRGRLPALPIYFHASRPDCRLDVLADLGITGIYKSGVGRATLTSTSSTVSGRSL